MPHLISLSSEIREARTAASLTQDELAELAGCSVWTIRAWEQGNVPRGRSHVLTIVRAILADLNDEGRPPQGTLVKASVVGDRHGAG